MTAGTLLKLSKWKRDELPAILQGVDVLVHECIHSIASSRYQHFEYIHVSLLHRNDGSRRWNRDENLRRYLPFAYRLYAAIASACGEKLSSFPKLCEHIRSPEAYALRFFRMNFY
jgi:hypothetical protein